jgi:hypothetical protein
MRGWALGRLHDAATGAEDLRRALADRLSQGARFDAWFYKAGLAELEAETLGAERALVRVDEAIALAREVETRCNLAFPYLLRGELLLKCDPPDRAAAEEAFRTAHDIAKEQGARCWGYAWRSRWPSSTKRRRASPTPTLYSRQHSKALCPRRSFLRLRRRWKC